MPADGHPALAVRSLVDQSISNPRENGKAPNRPRLSKTYLWRLTRLRLLHRCRSQQPSETFWGQIDKSRRIRRQETPSDEAWRTLTGVFAGPRAASNQPQRCSGTQLPRRAPPESAYKKVKNKSMTLWSCSRSSFPFSSSPSPFPFPSPAPSSPTRTAFVNLPKGASLLVPIGRFYSPDPSSASLSNFKGPLRQPPPVHHSPSTPCCRVVEAH